MSLIKVIGVCLVAAVLTMWHAGSRAGARPPEVQPESTPATGTPMRYVPPRSSEYPGDHLEKTRGRATSAPEPPRPVFVMKQNGGGDIGSFERWWQHIAANGFDVRIEGVCGSACTIFMAYIPSARVCMAEGAELGFHLARERQMASEVTKFDKRDDQKYTAQFIDAFYPAPVKKWLSTKKL